MAISFIVSILTARYLGPSNYGVISYAASFIAFFTSIASLGLNNTIVIELINNKDKEGTVLGTGIAYQVVSGLLSSVAIFLLVYFLNPDDSTTYFITILQSLSLVFQSFQLINYWYQSKLQSRVSTIVASVAYIIVTLYKVFLLITAKSVLWFAFSSSFNYIVLSLLLIFEYQRSNGQKLAFSAFLGRKMLKRSSHFILSGLMVAVYSQMDRIMIGSMMGKTSVGYYSASSTICNTWVFLLGAIIDSARPLIMEYRKENEALYERRLTQLYAAIIWISFIFSTVIFIFSKKIILLTYGQGYLDATSSLRILTWYTAFAYSGVVKNIWLVCEHKEKYVKYLSFAGAVSNLVLNFALIPTFGIAGAAFSSLATQVITNFLMPCIIKELRPDAGHMYNAFLLRGVISKQEIKKRLGNFKTTHKW